ncbi:hypothetical protein [Rhodococcus sp. UNC363MFTsu5.1]|uniref:hypothetical protein n=1 Tax=Rhodococcus sp. UNC363MFTsu5.1 TaxID=1449069 RepID=UPI0018CC40A2|nr:hypothetical protein [Rhodococcus sp. UNC363MFTsu5.1]
MVTDPLAQWWRWPVQVKRKAGEGPYGPAFDPPVTVVGKITAKRKKVLAPDGSEVISEARVSLPASTALIPPGSEITLPPEFSGRTAEVLAEQLHHDGAGRTPNYYSVDLT